MESRHNLHRMARAIRHQRHALAEPDHVTEPENRGFYPTSIDEGAVPTAEIDEVDGIVLAPDLRMAPRNARIDQTHRQPVLPPQDDFRSARGVECHCRVGRPREQPEEQRRACRPVGGWHFAQC